MPYNQISFDDLSIQIGNVLDDPTEVFWTRTEKYYALSEAFRVWGAFTNYWRSRGEFALTANQPYYDLAVQLPVLRSRSWTLQNMVQEIQYALLETPIGISGAGMSGQVSIQSILTAVARARNRFVLDAKAPFNVNATDAAPPPPDGLCEVPENTVYIHRASWCDSITGVYTNLWRQDAWEFDKANPSWTLEPGDPIAYSNSELSPLSMQLYPPPINEGKLELITIDSRVIDITNPASTFNIPDEWVHAVKYAALSDLFGPDSQLFDPLRMQYADLRYQQSVSAVQSARTILRVLVNNKPVPLDSLAALDAGCPHWRNTLGAPYTCGALHDFIVFADVPGQLYGCTVDVVRSAPLPVNGSEYIQIGREEIDNIIDYCTHYLTFKCGGNEFKATFANYDGFMKAASDRNAIDSAKIRFLNPLFGQPEQEEARRPESAHA